MTVVSFPSLFRLERIPTAEKVTELSALRLGRRPLPSSPPKPPVGRHLRKGLRAGEPRKLLFEMPASGEQWRLGTMDFFSAFRTPPPGDARQHFEHDSVR